MHDDAHGHTEEAENAADVLALELRQVIVDGDDVHAVAGQGIEVCRHGRRQRLAFAGLHFRNAALMQHDAAHHLHAELALARHAIGCLAHNGISLRQQLIERLALAVAVFEFLRLRTQLAVGELLVRLLKGIDFIDNLLQSFDLPGIRVE